MNADEHSHDQLAQQVHRLAQLAVCGDLSAADQHRLEELVVRNPEARDIYASFILDTVILRAMASRFDEAPSTNSETPAPSAPASIAPCVVPDIVWPADQPSTGLDLPDAPSDLKAPSLSFIGKLFTGGAGGISVPTFFAILIVALVFGAGMAVGLLRSISSPPRTPNSLAAARPVEIAPVAYLTSANGCAWGGDSLQTWTVGHSIESGSEIALQEGIAEFRLASGVTLGIEGPASLLLASPSKLVLQHGKLTAHVPWGAEALTAIVAGCRVSASDAEFGLSLADDGLEIHVFRGEVNAANSIASRQIDEEVAGELSVAVDDYFTDAIVAAGQSLQLKSRSDALRITGRDKAKPALFVNKLSMSGQLPVTDAYVRLVKASRPIAYWRFEEIVDSRVPNEIDPAFPLVASIESCVVGHRDNLAAEFWADRRCHFRTDPGKSLPLTDSNYSIEFWIKPSHLHRGEVIQLGCVDDQNSSARIELQGNISDSYYREQPGKIRFVHRTPGTSHKWGMSCFSTKPYLVRRWQHIVAVKTAKEMRLYIDGKFSNSEAEVLQLPADVRVLVGVHSSFVRRKLVGHVDELAIYDRALSQEEIVEHHKAIHDASTTLPADTYESYRSPDDV